jgi:hypothetical protein
MNRRRSDKLSVGCLAAVCVSGFILAVRADTPAEFTRPAALAVAPSELLLDGGNRRQQLLVSAKLSDGRWIDVTHLCQCDVAQPRIAVVQNGVVWGAADGQTQLTVHYAGVETKARLEVRGIDRRPAVHFGNDIVPLFTKLGCNSGGCHGKATGQNGFKLSVFGFDPRGDYEAIVKESRGRRVFPASPERSLLLAKPSMTLAHGGGRRLEPGSPEHQLILDWLRQSMPWGDDTAPRIARLETQPGERSCGFQSRQQIAVTAIYNDGTRRDVTSAAIYASNAPHVAEVDSRGVVRTGQAPGEAAITVSYLEQVAVVRIVVPRPDGPASYPDLPVNNEIDRLAWARLRSLGIVPSELCDDATFLRRVFLDAIGTLPTPEEVRAFLAEGATGSASATRKRRDRLIDAVLARDEFADYWALKWADILLVDQDKLGDRGAYEFHRWLREQFARNRPYDEWVRELITATGDSGTYGPANLFRALRTPEDAARGVSQAFLGVRIECAQCHHHPWERWGREDFYGFAGFFNGLDRRKLREDREFVFHTGYKPLKIPLLDTPAPARPLGGNLVAAEEQRGDPRRSLAVWLTSRENPWFARLAVNRLWKHFLGRGLVEPEDDFRSTNPPTNEPLLNYLAKQLVSSKFDLRAVARLIMQSRVYQLESATTPNNRDDDQNFSHFYEKRLPAEVLLDAISQATGTPEEFPGHPPGTRSIQLWNNRLPSYFLEIFGRPERNSPCECGRSSEPTLTQALHLMNAPQIEAKITHAKGRVAKLVAAGASQDKVAEELCLAALSRPPGQKERQTAARLFSHSPPRQAAEDLLWVLLNSYDSLFIR